MCRLNGPVSVATDIREFPPNLRSDRPTPPDSFDRGIKQVVIVGNGIAGVTAADYVRRGHPDCEIHVVGRERHALYNRMAISRLIYGRSAMNGLYLQPQEWYEERNITQWLNTRVIRINRTSKSVALATGEVLPFDRLILANGSSSAVPPIAGYNLPGAFVLREAEDAMGIRAYVQEHGCRRALVGGGGLLGLEAAFALHSLGLKVTVLERGDWLLRRQLDERGAQFLKRYLEGLGLQILHRAEIRSIIGEGRVQQATLTDGRELPCDLFLAAVGMVPNLELARAAALESNRGLLVDSRMQTSDPAIFGAGDVCEFDGQVLGLWPVAVEQARVAAINAIGEPVAYQAVIPVTTLKVVGIDLTSIGRFDARSEDDVAIVLEDIDNHRYRKLVISNGKVAGAILLGFPLEANGIATAVKEGRDLSEYLEDLRRGNWSIFSDWHT
jgi:NAD(P)H-nitrite reductase large subunit